MSCNGSHIIVQRRKVRVCAYRSCILWLDQYPVAQWLHLQGATSSVADQLGGQHSKCNS